MMRHIFLFIFLLCYGVTARDSDLEHALVNPFAEVDLFLNKPFVKPSNDEDVERDYHEEREAFDRTYNFLRKTGSRGEEFNDFVKMLSKKIHAFKATSTAEVGSGDRNDEPERCLDDFLTFLSDSATEFYARRMWDAWGTPENGILQGNVRWPGHYYECWNAKGPVVSGKWCNTYTGYKYEPYPMGIPVDISMGICFPSSCSEESVTTIFRTLFLPNYPNSPPLLKVKCRLKPQWSSADTICVVIASVLTVLVFAGTLLDLTFRLKRNNRCIDGEMEPEHSLALNVLLCFSVISNTEKILDMNVRPGTLATLDGIRFISTTWVILGHSFLFSIYALDNTLQARRRFRSDASLMPLINATFSVDTFFLLSGLLVAYLGMKHISKTRGRLNVPLMYLQRYLRLTPLYAFLLLLSLSLHKFMGSGPYWAEYFEASFDACKDVWWANLLYINNLYPPVNYCFSWGWYLADDMQFYIISPIFIILLYRWRKVGISVMFIVIVGGMISNGVQSSVYEIQPSAISGALSLSFFARFFVNSSAAISYEDKMAYDIYTLPWARVNVYMIGMLTGYILFITKGKIKMNAAAVTLGWILSAGCSLTIIYAFYENIRDMEALDVNLAAFYNAVSRPVWGACIAWVIVACIAGYGGPIRTFLNWKVFTPLSRLTYGAYLIQALVLYWYLASQENPFHFLMVNVIYYYLGSLVISFGCAFIVCLVVEWPFMNLMKLIFAPNTKKMSENNQLKSSSVSVKVQQETHTNSTYKNEEDTNL